MRNIIRSCSIVLFISVFLGSPNCIAGPRLEVVEEPWDFGEISEGDKEEKTFYIKNSGDETLVLDKVRSCCGYMVMDVLTWELEPGTKSGIKLISDTSRKDPGKDEKKITIISNDQSSPEIKIPVFSTIIGVRSEISIPEKPLTEPRQIPSITANELEKMIAEGKGMKIFDVREQEEFSLKHIPGAFHFSRSDFAVEGEIPLDVIEGITRDDMVIVYCGGGFRSNYIARKFNEKGFDVFDLEGGLKAWEMAGYELSKGPKVPGSPQPLTINLEEGYEHYFLGFKDKVVWIDTRDEEEYAIQHIDGAINISLHELAGSLGNIPRNKQLVLYCVGPGCDSSTSAAKILINNGYKKGRIMVLTNGMSGWSDKGYPFKGKGK
jgi:rhodanese-related sulfurtransferase